MPATHLAAEVIAGSWGFLCTHWSLTEHVTGGLLWPLLGARGLSPYSEQTGTTGNRFNPELGQVPTGGLR